MNQQHITDNLKDGQKIVVTIRPDYRAKDGVINGTVKRGHSYSSGKDWFYIVPAGDSHPGSSVTKLEILSIVI